MSALKHLAGMIKAELSVVSNNAGEGSGLGLDEVYIDTFFKTKKKTKSMIEALTSLKKFVNLKAFLTNLPRISHLKMMPLIMKTQIQTSCSMMKRGNLFRQRRKRGCIRAQ